MPLASKDSSPGPIVLTVSEGVVLAFAVHLLAASLTALRAIRRDYYGDKLSWWAVVGPAVLLHGAVNFVALSFGALEGNVGLIRPTNVWNIATMLSLMAVLVAIAAWLVRQDWQTLDDRDEWRE